MKLKFGEIKKIEVKDEDSGEILSWYEICDNNDHGYAIIEEEDKAAVIKFLQEN